MNKKKKYRRSRFAIACYVLAAAMLIFACYLGGRTVMVINQSFADRPVDPTAGIYFNYILEQTLQPLFYMVVFFMLGYILDEVRKNNKAYYLSDEEIAEAAIARKEAREAKKFAKGEAAAAKAGNVTGDELSVEADFARSLDAELKADLKKTGYKKTSGGNRKQGGNKNNASKKRADGRKENNGGEGKGGDNKGQNQNQGSKGSDGKGQSGKGGNNQHKKPAQPKQKNDAQPKKEDQPKKESQPKKEDQLKKESQPKKEDFPKASRPEAQFKVDIQPDGDK